LQINNHFFTDTFQDLLDKYIENKKLEGDYDENILMNKLKYFAIEYKDDE